MAEQKSNLTAAQRAALFAQATRQNMQMLPKQTINTGSNTVEFTLPKARLLSKILIAFKLKFKATHASKTELPNIDVFTPYEIIKKISVDINNGFSPYVIGGKECAMLNMTHRHDAEYIKYASENTEDTNKIGYWKGQKASTTGAENEVAFTLELPITLNDRDSIGAILLQNEQTVVNASISIGEIADMFKDNNGYTYEFNSMEIVPMVESFSIPASASAFPDLSVLKLVNSRKESWLSSGQQVVKLSTGTIYRKIIFMLTDAQGNPLADEDINDIQLVFNQADCNYSINPRLLRILNTTQYGFTLPKGMYVLDFGYQGIVGLSGSRDYVDTERLTECWLRFTTKDAGFVNIVTETLARLQ